MIIRQAKEVEEERNQKRTLFTEVEKLKFKIKCLEDDLTKQTLKAEKRL